MALAFRETCAQGRARRAPVCLGIAALLVWVACGASAAYALTREQDKLIDKGFKIFTKQTFKGNGRTCSTCHLAASEFNVSPADIPTLSAHQRKLLFATSVTPGNAGAGSLENPTMVEQLGLFNINDNVGGDPSEVGTGNNPAGPFRASMTIAGLAFTTSNLLPDFCASNSTPQVVENGTLLVVSDCPAVPEFPSPGVPVLLSSVFLGPPPPNIGDDPGPGVDEGTRNIELGWGGDGTVADPNKFGATVTSANKDCRDAIDQANSDPTDLTSVLRAFSLTAVFTHLPRSLNRVPGVDFRCPKPKELDALAAFQEYLGRRFELALKAGVPDDSDDLENALNNFAAGTQTDPSQPVITFSDPVAETGKAIFLDGHAQCNLCHFNAGANDIIGEIDAPNANDQSAPFPERNFTSHQLVDLMRCADKNGQPTDCLNASTATAHGLNALIAPVVFPQDPGDKIQAGGVSSKNGASDCGSGINSGGNTGCVQGKGLRTGGFNVQSLIEAPRKKSFFHNGAFTTNVEDAASFYFSPAADRLGAFIPPRDVGPGSGADALATLAETYFGDPSDTQQVLDTLGFFLRALSTVYAIADCERLVQDTMDRIDMHLGTKVPVLNCTNNLSDIGRMMAGARVTLPADYLGVQSEVETLKSQLKHAVRSRNKAELNQVLESLKSLRHQLATITPDLPI
jgi:cytochrome c peroxidase